MFSVCPLSAFLFLFSSIYLLYAYLSCVSASSIYLFLSLPFICAFLISVLPLCLALTFIFPLCISCLFASLFCRYFLSVSSFCVYFIYLSYLCISSIYPSLVYCFVYLSSVSLPQLFSFLLAITTHLLLFSKNCVMLLIKVYKI